mgnify:CR=1 FL=1
MFSGCPDGFQGKRSASSIDKAPTKVIPYFDFTVPTELPGVDPRILDPRDTYADPICHCPGQIFGPASARALPVALVSNFLKLLMNISASFLAFSSHSFGSA